MAPIEPAPRIAVDVDVEEKLRHALEPHPAVVDRLVRTALERTSPPAPKRWPVWIPVAAAAGVLILAVVLIPTLQPNPDRRTAPQVVELEPFPEPSVLRISNEDGPVTVTTPAGSKMILLPGDPS